MAGWDESWTIPGYFKGKNVFITGGTGFVGLVLIEKLLRSCPDVGNIYLLARKKRNKTQEDRIRELTDQELFDTVRKVNPKAFNKLKCVSGDIAELRLGLSEEDEKTLIGKINVIYHVAASVRFNDHLQDAIKLNLRGTVELLKLALKCENLEVFAHTSTAFCNSDIEGQIEEKVYSPSLDWKEALDLLEDSSRDTIETLTLKIIHPLKNTYTYTKRLAEQAVKDMCKDKINAVIVRPSIVTATVKEPVPGWLNNLNGPFSMAVAGVIGITSAYYLSVKSQMDVVYVDNIVKSLIIATRDKHVRPDTSEVSVYNGTSELMWSVQYFEEIYEMGREYVRFENALWYYNIWMTHNYPLFYVLTMLHLFAAAILDGVLWIQGKPTRLVKLSRAIYNAQMAVHFFVCHDFDFVRDNYLKLSSELPEYDRAAFQYFVPIGRFQQIGAGLSALGGTKTYTFKEKTPPPDWVNRRHQMLCFLRDLLHFIQPLVIVWVIQKCIF